MIRLLAALCAALLWAPPGHAQLDWANFAMISSTIGVTADRLCIGEGTRSDIGCPAYAPSLTSGGLLTAASFATGGLTVTGATSLTTVSATVGDFATLRVNGVPITGAGGGDNLGNHTATQALNIGNHAINSSAGTVIDGGGGWHRTYGNTGWYNGTHGGGWHMSDSTWLRATGDKWVYTPGVMRADGGIHTSQICNTAGTGCVAQSDLAGGAAANCPAQTVSMLNLHVSSGCYGVTGATLSFLSVSCPVTPHNSLCSGSNGASARCLNGRFANSSAGNTSSAPSSRSCSSCFAAGSRVLMADGTEKLIETIEVGEHLMGLDGKPTRVAQLDRPMMGTEDWDTQRLFSINGGEHFVTNNHPILTAAGWKALQPEVAETEAYDLLKGKVAELRIGDEVILHDKSRLVIRDIQVLEHKEPTKLYNFVLEGDPVFFVNKMAVMSFVPDEAGKYPVVLEHSGE